MSLEQPPSRLGRLTKWYGHVADILTPQRLLFLLTALTIFMLGLFGGWDAADVAADQVPEAKVGATVTAAPFDVTVTRGRMFHELPGVLYAEEGYRYLAIVMDVTNTSAEPVDAFVLAEAVALDIPGLRTIELDSGPQVIRPNVLRGVDSLNQRTFQPGLTTNIVLVWQQLTSAAEPATASVTFSAHTWRRSTLDGGLGWRDPSPVATLTLAIEPLEAP